MISDIGEGHSYVGTLHFIAKSFLEKSMTITFWRTKVWFTFNKISVFIFVSLADSRNRYLVKMCKFWFWFCMVKGSIPVLPFNFIPYRYLYLNPTGIGIYYRLFYTVKVSIYIPYKYRYILPFILYCKDIDI